MGFKTYHYGDMKVAILLDKVVSFHELETQNGIVLQVYMSEGQAHCLTDVSFDDFGKNFFNWRG
jgi:hypothetical protein